MVPPAFLPSPPTQRELFTRSAPGNVLLLMYLVGSENQTGETWVARISPAQRIRLQQELVEQPASGCDGARGQRFECLRHQFRGRGEGRASGGAVPHCARLSGVPATLSVQAHVPLGRQTALAFGQCEDGKGGRRREWALIGEPAARL